MHSATNKKVITKSVKLQTKPVPKSATKKATLKKTIPTALKIKTAPQVILAAQKSKQSQLIDVLRNPKGANITELMQATGWQAHSVRGVISGVIRKRLGLTVVTQKVDGIQRYRIAPV